MLRKSLVGGSGGNNNNNSSASSSAKKKGSIFSRAQRKGSVASGKARNSPRNLDNNEENDNVTVTIAPERIQQLCEYVKYFIPLDSREILSINEIEQLIQRPKTTQDKPDEHELAYQTMTRFLNLLQTAQMDHTDWFDFVLSKNNKQSDNLTLEEFSFEINRLSHDLRQSNFDHQHLRDLFVFITTHENDDSYPLERSYLDNAIKKFVMREQHMKIMNAVANELQTVSIYLRKMNVSLHGIMEVTNCETMNGWMKVAQLPFLMSSLILMFEIHVSEYGIPVISDLPAHVCVSPPTGPVKLHNYSTSSDSIHGKYDNSANSDLNREGTQKSMKSESSKQLEADNTATTQEKPPASLLSGAAPSLSKMVSFKSFKVPSTQDLTSSVSSMFNAIRKTLSFKGAPIAPVEENSVAVAAPVHGKEGSVHVQDVSTSSRKGKSRSVEVNSDFVKYLDYDERIKVLNLVRHLREGEDTRSPLVKHVNDTIDAVIEEERRNSAIRASIGGTTTNEKATVSAKSHKNAGFSKSTKANYIIINTGDDGEGNIEEATPLGDSMKGQGGAFSDAPLSPNSSSLLANDARRKSLISSTNRVENMKNEMIATFNTRVTRASLIMSNLR